MYPHDRVYAFDIETLTDPENPNMGLDPSCTPVTAVAVAAGPRNWVFTGSEADILTATFALFDELADGLLVTWNGACFDIPFLVSRARLLGVTHSFRTQEHSGVPCKYVPTPGWSAGVVASWAGTQVHGHMDIAALFAADAAAAGVAWSLKPVAKAVLGVVPVEVDRHAMHELSAQELYDYVLSDADITWKLAVSRLVPFPVG